ncbi:sensor histidine kinase [soil metagenome]
MGDCAPRGSAVVTPWAGAAIRLSGVTVHHTAAYRRPMAAPPRPPGPFVRWPRAADAALASAMFLLMTFVSSAPNDDLVVRAAGDVPISAVALFAVASGALYWRRTRPLIVFGVTLAATALTVGSVDAQLVGVAMLVALYSVGRHCQHERWSYVALGAALAFATISSRFDGTTLAETGFGVFLIIFIWYGGRQLRMRVAHAARLERERAAEARRVVTEERTRIARELHDVVAHRVSLMTIQAGAAKTVAADDPAGAARAMQTVETAGRQALDELRHLLGVLRPDADAGALGPQPGLDDVPALVEQFRSAGLDVSLTTDGAPIELPDRVGLSAYRIVQESLTNALRHAGSGARTEVRIDIDGRGVAIEVSDNGPGTTSMGGSGHGIVGMRERASLLGGRLDAGPRPGGGFQVVAQLPVGQEAL